MRESWLYMRLHCPSAFGDTVALKFVRPLAEELRAQGLITRFFFLRYFEGGHHLRLRFYGEQEALLTTVRSRLNVAASSFFSEHGYSVTGPLDDGPAGMDDTGWQPRQPYEEMRPICSFEYDRYEPETERYGGQAGLLLSEQQFEVSSLTALRVLELEQAGAGPRQNAALLLIEAISRAFDLSRSQCLEAFAYQVAYWTRSAWLEAEHIQRFAQEYARFRASLQRLLALGEAASLPAHRSRSVWLTTVQEWEREMRGFYEALLSLQQRGQLSVSLSSLLCAYIHLLCNRLGIFPREETCLAYLLQQCYAEEYTAV